jgi:ferritin heavy chain
VALSGFSKFFSEQSEEEHEHARHFIKYQNMRGGRVVFQDVPKPATDDWESALAAVQAALTLEKKVNQVKLFLFIVVHFQTRVK